MELASSTFTVVLGSVFFGLFILINSVDSVVILPVGRGGATFMVGVLMVVGGILSNQDFYNSMACNLALWFVIFGTMILCWLLEAHGHLFSTVFRAIDRYASTAASSASPAPLLPPAAVAMLLVYLFNCAATPFLAWDTTTIALAPHALALARKRRWRLRPFAAAVTIGSNLGSVLTPVANPGNVLVALASIAGAKTIGGFSFTPTPITFLRFCAIAALPWACSVVVGAGVLLARFWSELREADSDDFDFDGAAGAGTGDGGAGGGDGADTASCEGGGGGGEGGAGVGQGGASLLEIRVVDPATDVDTGTDIVADADMDADADAESGGGCCAPLTYDALAAALAPYLGAGSGYVAWAVAIALWLAGKEVGIVAMGSAALGIALAAYAQAWGWDGQWRSSRSSSSSSGDTTGAEAAQAAQKTALPPDAQGMLMAAVHHPVLYYILFVFPTVTGFVQTGVPGAFWSVVEPHCSCTGDNPAGLALLVVLIVVYVQVMTNVPAVMLLGDVVAALAVRDGASSTRGYLLTAVVGCVAGCLTINGSVTQVITYGMCRGATGGRVAVSNAEHLSVGAPVVAAVLLVAVPAVLAMT